MIELMLFVQNVKDVVIRSTLPCVEPTERLTTTYVNLQLLHVETILSHGNTMGYVRVHEVCPLYDNCLELDVLKTK